MIPKVSDIHTHNRNATDCVINLERGASPERNDAMYSVGWHPWWGCEGADLKWVEATAADRRVVMIGECGIDRLRGGDIEEQIELTQWHAELAERLGKPLILHIVGAWSEIIGLRKRMRPVQPWVIHGFRGKPALASQLVAAGFYLSLGPKSPAKLAEVIPPDRLLHETD